MKTPCQASRESRLYRSGLAARHPAFLLIAALFFAPQSARAAAGDLADLEALQQALACRNACAPTDPTCPSTCPLLDTRWDRNADGVVDAIDYQLSVEAYWDENAGALVCRQGNVVIPREACEATRCAELRPAAECRDRDADGILAYQEDLLGTSDQQAEVACTTDADCAAPQACLYRLPVNRKLCLTRTAFHLETAAADRDQVLVHVFYDYSPTPARALQLRLRYDPAALRLDDARALPRLRALGKRLAVERGRPGELRLVVLGTQNLHFVPTGRVIELVFTRVGDIASTIRFSDDPFHREQSVAPVEDPKALLDPSYWGAPLTVAARGGGSDRLLLHYGFDSLDGPLSLNAAPSAAALCELASGCSVTDERRVAALRGLQAGRLVGGEYVEGVSGPGVYLQSGSDHLELPLWLAGTVAPLADADQSYSASTWFLYEPQASDGPEPAVLLSQANAANQLSRHGLAVRPRGSVFDLLWFLGDIGDTTATLQPVATGLPLRTWAHVGYAVNAGAAAAGGTEAEVAPRSATVYLDGRIVAEGLPIAGPAPDVVLACPRLDGNGRAQLRDVGEVAGGTLPERVWVGTNRASRTGIDTIGLPDLVRSSVLSGDTASFQDPDYSAITDRLLFSADLEDGFEIWVAKSDGSGARRVTRGFGDASRGVLARRPRWAPDGSGFVFESNAFAPGGFNAEAKAFHLYYVGFDAATGEVAADLGGPTPVTELPFEPAQLGRSLTTGDAFAVDTRQHHRRAVWIRGASNVAPGPDRGELWVQRTELNYGSPEILRLRIPAATARAEVTPDAPLGPGVAVELLAAHRGVGNSSVPVRLLRTTDSAGTTLYIQRGDAPPQGFTLAGSPLDRISEAVFSPRADRLLLAGFASGRPALVLTRTLFDVTGTQPLPLTDVASGPVGDEALRIEGLDWEAETRLFPCGWVGGIRNPVSGEVDHGFSGAIDELKVHGYLRGRASFRSEAERGQERLAKAGRAGQQPARIVTCNNSNDCGPQQICQAGVCAVVGCDPSLASSCPAGSRCTLAPLAADATLRWQCVADCVVDADCFRQQCAGGPCRFCEAGLCTECRTVSVTAGGLTQQRMEGCADARTFACEAGTCVSECYRFEDEQSIYTCDPALEQCRGGRCVAEAWSWSDIAPATFGGLGRMALASLPEATVVRSQNYTVKVVAFGEGDAGHDPALLLEGQRQGRWLALGAVSVTARRPAAANAAPLSLSVSFPFERLRMRLLTPPQEPSLLRAGYSVHAPYPRLSECRDAASPGYCGVGTASAALDVGRRYLHGGGPAVVVTAVEVEGSSVLTPATVLQNQACAYRLADGTTGWAPAPLAGQAIALLVPGTSLDATLITGKSWALLNCADTPTAGGARLELSVASNLFDRTDSRVIETANSCRYVVNGIPGDSCYEWSDVLAVDALASRRQPLRTIDISELRSFGWGAGSPSRAAVAPVPAVSSAPATVSP